LQQLGYDPYGIGFTDPYQAGVTPGFINLDINRETGLHLGVGTVAVDVSADKNYVGFGVGNIIGVGAARDRGWNLQLGGGNVLDASVTKDAGLGLWILDGLVNVQIGPDGTPKGAATGFMRQAAAAVPSDMTSIVVDDTTATTLGQPTASSPAVIEPPPVAVDVVAIEPPTEPPMAGPTTIPLQDIAAGPTTALQAEDSLPATPAPVPMPVSSNVAVASTPGVASSPTAVGTMAAPVIIIDSVDYDPNGDITATEHRVTTAASRQRMFITPRPAVQPEERSIPDSSAVAAGGQVAAARPIYLTPRPVTVTEDDALWTTASQYPEAAVAGATWAASGSKNSNSDMAESGSTTNVEETAARRACAGGVVEWMIGSKYRCKYKKAQLLPVPPPGAGSSSNGTATASEGIAPAQLLPVPPPGAGNNGSAMHSRG
jgi:hypothetical protein